MASHRSGADNINEIFSTDAGAAAYRFGKRHFGIEYIYIVAVEISVEVNLDLIIRQFPPEAAAKRE